MSKVPVVEGILRYIEEKNSPFSMPGHKAGRGLQTTRVGCNFVKNIIRGDITEVDGLDNLHNPEGMIKEAQELLRDLYGSRKSYFLVNGSTSGNLAMIFSSFSEGDKIIVERNCHRSIFNGILMRKLKPVYIKNLISKRFNAPFSIDMEHFLRLINEDDNIKGIVLTYPNYYGMCMDLGRIVSEAKMRNIKVLIDSAHGAHFGISEFLPQSAVKLGADMVVMSAHKTLPSLTQTAYLHVCDTEAVERTDFYVSAFTSTSPSYPLLAALDYARYYMEAQGKEGFENCIALANKYRDKINQLEGFHVITREDIKKEKNIFDLDESRFIINISKGANGHQLLRYLRSKGVQAEMSDENNVVLISSPFNTEKDFERLYSALKAFPSLNNIYFYKTAHEQKLPEVALQPHEIMGKSSLLIELQDAAGCIAAKNIVPYPPGVPLVMAGEYMDSYFVDLIKHYLDNEITVLGIEDGRIAVVKNQG